MTRTTKILLAVALGCLGFGLTGINGAIGIPFGVIFLGLALISKLMEKEAALYDEEQRSRREAYERSRHSETKTPRPP